MGEFRLQVGSIGGGQLEFWRPRGLGNDSRGTTWLWPATLVRFVSAAGGIVDLTFNAVDRPETEPEYGFPCFCMDWVTWVCGI